MNAHASIRWNPELKLALADVDETIAEVYTPATPAMINELSTFLSDGGRLFMVTGGGLGRVLNGITHLIAPGLRQYILISHCSGAEVWGFMPSGELRDRPFYSIYEETFTDDMKGRWRQAVVQLVDEFGLRIHGVRPKSEFWDKIGHDPLDIMLDDRGSQITMEVVNGHHLTSDQRALFRKEVPLTIDGRYDLRLALMRRADELFREMNVPVTARLGGVFALDFAIKGSSKTTSVRYALDNPCVLKSTGLDVAELTKPTHFEVWGDKYSVVHGGTDRHMSEALPSTVRSIDFRNEKPDELPNGYNIVIWNGRHHLHHGLLEYLQSRHISK